MAEQGQPQTEAGAINLTPVAQDDGTVNVVTDSGDVIATVPAQGGRGWQEYAKAIAAFLTAGLTSLSVALQEASDGGATITPSEGVGIALAVVAVTGVVWGVPNKRG